MFTAALRQDGNDVLIQQIVRKGTRTENASFLISADRFELALVSGAGRRGQRTL
ncbi:hypothetical protein SK128_013415, partial [Halocaridina rubra]